MTESGSVLRADWLVDQLWSRHGGELVAAARDADAALVHDVFAALLTAEPQVCPTARRRHPAHARVIDRLAGDARIVAVRSLTVGDEHACAQWAPRIALTLVQESAAVPAVTGPVSEEGGGGARAAALAAALGDGEDVDAAGERAGAGPATTDDPLPDDAVLARLLDTDGREGLRRLVLACRTGLRAHAGFADALRPRIPVPARTRDPARVAGDVWLALASPESETPLWRDWTRGGLRGVAAAVPEPRAPLLILADESGSMQLLLDGVHTRRTWALATVLAAAELAAASGHEVVYLGFGGDGCCWRQDLPVHEAGALRRALARVCRHSFGGGTAFDAPIEAACAVLADRSARGARVLVLSDGEGALCDDALAARWRASRLAAGARCWGVRIGGGDETPLTVLCDAVAQLEEFARADLEARFPLSARAGGVRAPAR